MFSVNGVPLDNDALGWWLSAKTAPFPGVTSRAVQVQTPGRPGVRVLNPVDEPRPWGLVLTTTIAKLPDLFAWFSQWPLAVTRTVDPSRSVLCTRLSMSDPTVFNAANLPDTRVEVPVLLQLDQPYWRDTAEQTVESALTSSTILSCFTGMSAPIWDALIRVTGPTSTVQITNPATGAVVGYPTAIPAGKALLYDSAAQSARVVDSGQWSGGSDVSGLLNLSGRRLTITPTFTDPATRVGKLTVDASGTTASSKIAVRGKGAYLIG